MWRHSLRKYQTTTCEKYNNVRPPSSCVTIIVSPNQKIGTIQTTGNRQLMDWDWLHSRTISILCFPPSKNTISWRGGGRWRWLRMVNLETLLRLSWSLRLRWNVMKPSVGLQAFQFFFLESSFCCARFCELVAVRWRCCPLTLQQTNYRSLARNHFLSTLVTLLLTLHFICLVLPKLCRLENFLERSKEFFVTSSCVCSSFDYISVRTWFRGADAFFLLFGPLNTRMQLR